MLRFTITKEQYEALSDVLRAEYRADGDSYVLDTVGDHPAVSREQQRNARLAQDLNRAQDELGQANAKVATAKEDAEKATKEKLEKAEKSLSMYREQAVNSANDKAINGIAQLFNAPDLFHSSLQSRVRTTEGEDGKLVTKFYDKDGNETTSEKLSDEYCKNPAYSGMLKTSQHTPTVPRTLDAPATNNTQAVTIDPVTQLPIVDYGKASDAEKLAAIDAYHAAQDKKA